MLRLAGLLFLSTAMAAAALPGPDAREHPFLITPPEAAARAQEALEQGGPLAEHAQALKREAMRADIAALPSLDDEGWWEENKDRSWRDTYPEISRLTGQVPREWAAVLHDCARAHLLFPDEGFDQKAREILLGLADYSFVYEHYDVGMNYITWGYRVLDAYDILYDSFSQEERAKIDAFFARMLEAVEKNDALWVAEEPGGAMNNHYAWHKLGMLMYGLFYGDEGLVEEALFGPKAIVESMRYGFTGEGLWLEASINYQFAATAPMMLMAEMLENADVPWSLYDYRTDDGRTLRQSYDALFDTLFPDGTLPNIGDAYARRAHPGDHWEYEVLFRRFEDPRYAWLIQDAGERGPLALWEGVPELPPGEAPMLDSQLWPEHGYAMLRSNPGEDYWTEDAWTAFVSYSNAPVHNHQDKLSLMLFGNGRHWLVDADAKAGVYHAFSSVVQRELNHATLCHNTLLVDGASQRSPSAQLELIEFHALPEGQRVTIGDTRGLLYEGVRQLRTVHISPDYVLDVFQVRAESPRRFAWMTHVDGARENDGQEWQATELPQGRAWKWLHDGQAMPVDAAWSQRFTHQGDAFRIDGWSDGPGRLVRADFPRTDDPDNPLVYPMLLHEREGDAAVFVAIYRLDNTDAPAELGFAEAAMGQAEVTVTIDGETRRHLVPRLSEDGG